MYLDETISEESTNSQNENILQLVTELVSGVVGEVSGNDIANTLNGATLTRAMVSTLVCQELTRWACSSDVSSVL